MCGSVCVLILLCVWHFCLCWGLLPWQWGDRSQISTIALAAAHNPYGVTLGGILGHAMCTGGAVLGGRALSTKISPRSVNTAGGILFLLFAVHGVYVGPI